MASSRNSHPYDTVLAEDCGTYLLLPSNARSNLLIYSSIAIGLRIAANSPVAQIFDLHARGSAACEAGSTAAGTYPM